MTNKIQNAILIICGICAMIITTIIIICGIKYLKEPYYNSYDVNHDGKVNSLDLLKVQKYILEQNNNN